MLRINISIEGDHDDEAATALLEAATKAVEESAPVYRAWWTGSKRSGGRYGGPPVVHLTRGSVDDRRAG